MTSVLNRQHIRVPATSASVGIKVRRMDMGFTDDIPDFWFNNDAFMTLFLTAFSATLPEGEKQFIQSVRHYQDRISDPVLLAEVRAFIGQEAHHAREHDALNMLMKRKGYPIEKIETFTRDMNAWFRTKLPPEKQLAITVCAEHITALMADYFLTKAPKSIDRMAEPVRTLWAWHAVEEAEHKAVAFDVYKLAVDDPWLLRKTMFQVTMMIFRFNAANTRYLLRHSGHSRNLKTWAKGLNFLFGWKGMVPSIAKDYMDFYLPGFHPWKHDNRKALQVFRERFLGE